MFEIFDVWCPAQKKNIRKNLENIQRAAAADPRLVGIEQAKMAAIRLK